MTEREDLLRLSIKRAVEKYEPRLKNVQITPADIKDQKSRVSFILSGQMMNGRQVTFHTTLSTMEPSKVIQYKKPE
jgi:predicted component of type VI protein secretion system